MSFTASRITGFTIRLALYTAVFSGGVVACSSEAPPQQVQTLRVEVLGTRPFDQTSFTQGLEVDGDSLLVGTGQEGSSRIYRSSFDGVEEQSVDLDSRFFGEGITRTGDHVWQLTWRHGVALKRDAASLSETGQATYSGEGWGLCSFSDRMIMSDGTSQLRVLDPETFVERERIHVMQAGAPVDKLNELECVEGSLYANRFLTSEIVRIDAASGEVTATIDASNLESNAPADPNNVLNGIAHIPGTDRFFLGGKRWPQLYEVRFVAD